MPTGDLEIIYRLADKYIKPGGIALEVGSWKGKSSYVIASVARDRGAKFICIDTFSGSTNRDYDTYREALADPDKFFNENIKINLSEFTNIEFIREDSQTAHKKIKDQSLDFCFIDGDHDLPAVWNDVRNYLTKVKTGGIFFGHDYFEDHRNDVRKVVDEIIGINNFILDGSMWIHKKKNLPHLYSVLSNYLGPADYLKKVLEKNSLNKDLFLWVDPNYKENEANWFLDSTHRVIEGQEAELSKQIKKASVAFYTQPSLKTLFEKNNKNSHLVTFAADPDLHRAYDVKKEYEVGFIGEPSNRLNSLNKIKLHFNMLVIDGVEDINEYSKLLSSCKVIYNKTRYGEINMRLFEGMAIGPLVAERVKDLNFIGKENEHFLTFNSDEEAISQIKKLLSNQDYRETMAKKARSHIINNHTYNHRLQSILTKL